MPPLYVISEQDLHLLDEQIQHSAHLRESLGPMVARCRKVRLDAMLTTMAVTLTDQLVGRTGRRRINPTP